MKYIFLSLFIFLNCIVVQAEEQILELSKTQAIELAQKNSQDLNINKENLKKLNNIYNEVRSSIFPQVNASIGTTKFIESPTIDAMGMSFSLYEDWESSIGLELSQVLWAFGKVLNAIELAENYIKLEQISEDITKNELSFAVKQLYYSILFAEKTVKISQESHENALKNKQALDGKFSGGRTSRVNNLKMEADIASRIPTVLQAQRSLKIMQLAMIDVLGLKDDSTIKLTDSLVKDFPAFNIDHLQQQMLSNTPILNLYREQLKIADIQLKLKKSNFYPTLAGFMTYNYSGGDDTIIPEKMDPEIIAGINLSCNVWDSGAKKNAYKQAINDKNITSFEYKKQEERMRTNLKTVLTEYEFLLKTYSANKTATNLAKQSYEITLSSFKSGSASQTMLNDAELQLTGASMAEQNTLFNINLKIAEIEKLIAGERS